MSNSNTHGGMRSMMDKGSSSYSSFSSLSSSASPLRSRSSSLSSHHHGHHRLPRKRCMQMILMNLLVVMAVLGLSGSIKGLGTRQEAEDGLFTGRHHRYTTQALRVAGGGNHEEGLRRVRTTASGAIVVTSSPPAPAAVVRSLVEPSSSSSSSSLPSFCIMDEDIDNAPRHHVYIAAPLHNSALFVGEFLQAVADQDYHPHVTVVIYDDASTDGSADIVESTMHSLPFRTVLLRGQGRHGPAFAKWELMQYIREHATDLMDLVLFLDADDKFFHPGVLKEVDATFREEKPWFAYGRIRGYYEEECGAPPSPLVYYPNNQTSSVRMGPWRYCHPRIMRVFLLNHFEENDFRDPNNPEQRWLLKYTDRQLVYKALELSGDQKWAYMGDRGGGRAKPHVYYRMTGNSTVYLDKDIKKADLTYVVSLAAVPEPLPEPIHIVSCAFARVSLLREVLTANIENQDVGGRPIYLHVCNNGDSEQEAVLESILSSVKGLAGYRLRTFADNPGGFARFYMMQDAIKEFNVDYFVMLDDDIMLPAEHGLKDLMAEARPQEYNAWWGRHYKAGADYFFSKLSPPDLKAGRAAGISTFHYAGTGLSVIDANIVRFYFPLLDKVPDRYRKVEDLWLSFVAHQLGWRVRRIVMPGVIFMEDGNINKNEESMELVQTTSLWRQLKEVKTEMLEDLRVCGWNVR